MNPEMERNFYKNLCQVWDQQFGLFISVIRSNEASNEVIATTMESVRKSLQSVCGIEVKKDEVNEQ